MDEFVRLIYEGVIKGDAAGVKQDVQAAVDAQVDAEYILKQGLIPAVQKVGDLFEKGEYYVPEMLISARAMQSGLELLKPLLASADVQSTGKVVLGTVQGDLHDIGKNLVGMMLEGAGFELVDLGTDVSPEKFADAVQENQPDIIAMSALLTTTMPSMKKPLSLLCRLVYAIKSRLWLVARRLHKIMPTELVPMGLLPMPVGQQLWLKH